MAHTGVLPSSKPHVTQHRSLRTVAICAKQRPRQAARVVSSLGHDVEAEVMTVLVVDGWSVAARCADK